jgi:RNA polymerase sigma-70 factor (ECF subfamily)
MTKRFRKLAEEYGDRVYTFALYSLRRPEEAEDVTQEVLVKLWQYRENIDPKRMTPWVMRVTKNAVLDVMRRRRTRSAVIADGVELEVAANYVAAVPNTETVVEQREFRDALESALATLEEPYRSIVVMREIQDMKYAEIVEVIDLPLNTVKVYLHRGRKMLRAALKGKV